MKQNKYPIVYRSIINFETGECEIVPESKEQRKARLQRRRRTAFGSKTAMKEARLEAVTVAWQRVYAGEHFPIHFDVVTSSKDYSHTERCTLHDTVFVTHVFDETQVVGSKDSIKLSRRRPKNVPADFVHHVKVA